MCLHNQVFQFFFTEMQKNTLPVDNQYDYTTKLYDHF